MDERIGRGLLPSARAGAAVKKEEQPGVRVGVGGIGLALGVYGIATALMIFRAPEILGERWAWLAVVVVPVLTLLVTFLRTGTALAMVLVYAFFSATAMAVQGYRLGWGEAIQAEYVLSHFATVFFMAGAVALVAQLRSRQEALDRAQELVGRYMSEDEATGLLTVEAFKTAASREVGRSHRTSRPLLLLAIDLSGYFGPGYDSAATVIAERMLGTILCSQTRGDQDLWTMWDKDVYLGLLAETDEQAIEPALERVLTKLVQAPEFAGQAVIDRARFGAASYPMDGYNLDLLLALTLGDLVSLEELRWRIKRQAPAPTADRVGVNG